MRIQHNITALNAHRQLGTNQTGIGKNLEKLSSGFRINRAGDDAAGLAISEKMRSQIKGLETASKNAQDGISLVQTAEGALTEVHSMLNRMTELATQSANGTYDNTTDRANLQKELNQLRSEVDRISESTNFNGINLLNGELDGGSAPANGLLGGKIANYKAAMTADTTAADASGGNLDLNEKDTFLIDGVKVEVDWKKLSAEDKAVLATNWTDSPTAENTKKAASIMEKAINEAIDKVNKDGNADLNHISVKAGATDGTFNMSSGLSGSSVSSIVVLGEPETNKTVMGVLFGATDADALAGTSLASATAKSTVSGTELNGKFDILIDGETVGIDMSAAGLNDGSTPDAIVSALNTAIDVALAKYDTSKGTTGTDSAIEGKIVASLTSSGQLEFANTSGMKIGFADKDGGEIAKTLGISAEGKAIAGGGLTLQIGDTAEDFNKMNVSISNMSSDSLGIASLDIGKQEGASAAIEKIKAAINTVSSTRGDLGAIQNRLEHTINNLGVTTENMTAAESRIRDVDMAKEMMEFTKNNILSQAATSMLAQANQTPQGVLQLLQ